MPAGDKKGPAGMGPRSGRASGYCAGYDSPGYVNRGFSAGFGRGFFGRRSFGRRGNRYWFQASEYPGWMRYGAYSGAYPAPAPLTPEQEQEALKEEEAWLQEQLDAVRSRMKEKAESKKE